MSDTIQDRKVFSLMEVSRSIQKTLQERYTSTFWVKAEMNKLNKYKHSGHCYPELVEKQDGKIITQMRAILWRDDYLRADANFLSLLKEPLKDGIKILFLAKISFDPAYGLSLHILDIDPAFTLGDLEREKQESISKLKAAGIYERNKLVPLALLPQRIAIISVESSKGFADFSNVLKSNPWQYAFFYMLFPSLLQGDKAVPGIIAQLQRIKKVQKHFDLVAIIRGGGGDVGLSCYNNFELAQAIALFPLPVFTGIGHATNETVCEMISHTNAITPTKLADLLLQKFHNYSVPVKEAEERISDLAMRYLTEQKAYFDSELKLFRSVCKNLMNSQMQELNHISVSLRKTPKQFFPSRMLDFSVATDRIVRATKQYIEQQNTSIKHLTKNLDLLHPDQVLKRGYSITTVKGKSITKAGQVSSGDTIITKLFEGQISSTVNSKSKTRP